MDIPSEAARRGMTVLQLFRVACAWFHRCRADSLTEQDYRTYQWSGIVPYYVMEYLRWN